jgi:hypothetical protein
MNSTSLLYLGITSGLFAVFAVIVGYTCSRKRKERFEEAKHRMLDED